jgi:hypothetical protein
MNGVCLQPPTPSIQSREVQWWDSVNTSFHKIKGLCGKNIQRAKIEIEGKIIEQVSSFNYLGNLISNEEKDINIKLQIYNKMNGIIKRNFRKHMSKDTKLRIHNITL